MGQGRAREMGVWEDEPNNWSDLASDEGGWGEGVGQGGGQGGEMGAV